MIYLTIIIVCILIYVWWRWFYFFRDPDRKIPKGNNIVSPADGKIIYIKKITDGEIPMSIKKGKKILLNELTKVCNEDYEEAYLIGIFMYPTSVHVQRAPIDGFVKNIHYHKAKNKSMIKIMLKSILNIKPYYKNCPHILENERNTTIIHGEIPVIVVQIAETIVNKIVSFVKIGDKVKKGSRIGIIKMGSQVDLIIPKISNLEIIIKEDIYVHAGETIIAKY
jgi:phosphatidylserine decarboxylase